MAFREIRPECVHCHTPMAKTLGRDSHDYHCLVCGAVLIDPSELTVRFQKAQPERELEIIVHNDGSSRDECPICAEPMDISWVEFLRFEACAVHGYWFEPRQLDRLLAYDVIPSGLPDWHENHVKRPTGHGK